MGDYFDWWWKGGSWYDLQQQDQLSAMSASHARSTSRLRTKMRQEAKRSKDLSTRVTRLEDAVLAFVELEDLRAVMENFSDAVATRRYARDVLAQIPALGRVASTTTPQVPPDVPDYWLHPAVRAVDARFRGDAAGEAAAADEARRRDPVRTAQFLAAVAILSRSSVADDDLATLWPTTRQVSQYQRSLWVAVANGGLGDDARAGLVGALTWVLGNPAEEGSEPDDATRFLQVRQRSASRLHEPLETVVMSSLLERRTPKTPATAASALTDLRDRVTEALQAGQVAPEEREVPDGVADLLAQVVSAGAPAEEPLVERIVEIRKALAAIGASTSIAAPAMLDEQALDVLELVRSDLDAGADPGARAVAVMALREPIENVAVDLAELAAQPIPDTSEVRVAAGVRVAVSSVGAVEPDWRARVGERLRAGAPSESGAVGELIAGGILGVLGLVLGVIGNPAWLLLLAPALGIAGHGFWKLRSGRAALAERTERSLSEATRKVDQQAHELAGELVAMRQRQEQVPEDVRAVRDELGAALV